MYVSASEQVIGLSLMKVNNKRFPDSNYVSGDAITGLRDVTGASGDGPRYNGGNPPPQSFGMPIGTTSGPGRGGNRMGGGFLGAPNVEGLPLNKPPYGTISAINLDRGELVWQVPHGDTPDAVRNNPLLKDVNVPRTGQSTSVGTLEWREIAMRSPAG